MRKEEIAPQSKWSKSLQLQSKIKNSENYKVSDSSLSLEQLVTRAEPAPLSIPLSVLASDIAPATAIAQHLKTTHSLSYAEIARALNRDHRTIWTLLNRNNQEQHPRPAEASHHVPLAIFTDRRLSILEHTVKHLRAQGHTIRAIAQLLNKHPSTISTAAQRARRKR